MDSSELQRLLLHNNVSQRELASDLGILHHQLRLMLLGKVPIKENVAEAMRAAIRNIVDRRNRK